MNSRNEKKVFSGVIFDVYQWDQKMYDGSTEVFERAVRDSAASIICVVDGKILFQKQEQPHCEEPFMSLPGGRIEKGEDMLEGAKRELLEEMGYSGGEWELLQETNPGHKVHFKIACYIVRGALKTAEPSLDPGEKIEPMLVSFEELLDMADEDDFMHDDLRPLLIRAKYNEESREALKKKIFGI